MAKRARADHTSSLKRVTVIPRRVPRRRDGHKGDYGRVLVIGGARGMIGAPALTANGALRSGAGLATVAVPRSVQLAVATLCPCATSIALPEKSEGVIEPAESLRLLVREGLLGQGKPSAVAIGPGLGRAAGRFDDGAAKLVSAFMNAEVPVVIDADGLNALSRLQWRRLPWRRAVLTPHPGEMARLHQTTVRVVQEDREAIAVRTARTISRENGESVVVLKGSKTIVTDGTRVYVNRTGNPGMATGGTGDVLTGMIAGYIAQGLGCFDAAVGAVHAHGKAGDRAANSRGEAAMIATDLLEYL